MTSIPERPPTPDLEWETIHPEIGAPYTQMTAASRVAWEQHLKEWGEWARAARSDFEPCSRQQLHDGRAVQHAIGDCPVVLGQQAVRRAFADAAGRHRNSWANRW